MAATDTPAEVPDRRERCLARKKRATVRRTEMMTVSWPSTATNCRLMALVR